MIQSIDLPVLNQRYANSGSPDTGYSTAPAYWGWSYNQQWYRVHAWFELQWTLLSNIHDHQIINAELNVTLQSNFSNAIDTSLHVVKPTLNPMDKVTWNHRYTPYYAWNVPGGIGMDTDIYSTPLETRKFTTKSNVISITAAEVLTLRSNSRSILFYSPNQPPTQSIYIHYVSDMFLRVYYIPGLAGDVTIF